MVTNHRARNSVTVTTALSGPLIGYLQNGARNMNLAFVTERKTFRTYEWEVFSLL